jgi:hypothetical protein
LKNSCGSLPSAGHEIHYLWIPQGEQLARDCQLIIKSALPALEIKISIAEKAEIRDSIFDPKNINQSHHNSARIGLRETPKKCR